MKKIVKTKQLSAHTIFQWVCREIFNLWSKGKISVPIRDGLTNEDCIVAYWENEKEIAVEFDGKKKTVPCNINSDNVDYVARCIMSGFAQIYLNKNESINKKMNKKTVRLTESDLHRIIKESVNRILRESEAEDEFDEFMSQYDEEGTTFNVEQYHYTLGNPMMSYEQIVHKTGLTKEEAWNVFKEAAIKAYKYNDKAIPSYGSVKDYIGYPVVSTEISTIYGNTKTKYPTGDDREIVNNISFQKEEGTYTSWKELCQKFLDRAEESFFKGEYEYTSY